LNFYLFLGLCIIISYLFTNYTSRLSRKRLDIILLDFDLIPFDPNSSYRD
jgi:hypothetical protein